MTNWGLVQYHWLRVLMYPAWLRKKETERLTNYIPYDGIHV